MRDGGDLLSGLELTGKGPLQQGFLQVFKGDAFAAVEGGKGLDFFMWRIQI